MVNIYICITHCSITSLRKKNRACHGLRRCNGICQCCNGLLYVNVVTVYVTVATVYVTVATVYVNVVTVYVTVAMVYVNVATVYCMSMLQRYTVCQCCNGTYILVSML